MTNQKTLVERLRDGTNGEALEAAGEAADEIERLTRERDEACNKLSALHEGAGFPVETPGMQALLTVQQENKRLRAALAAIQVGTPDLMPPYRALGVTQLREIAFKALHGAPAQETTVKVCNCEAESALDCSLGTHDNVCSCECHPENDLTK